MPFVYRFKVYVRPADWEDETVWKLCLHTDPGTDGGGADPAAASSQKKASGGKRDGGRGTVQTYQCRRTDDRGRGGCGKYIFLYTDPAAAAVRPFCVMPDYPQAHEQKKMGGEHFVCGSSFTLLNGSDMMGLPDDTIILWCDDNYG